MRFIQTFKTLTSQVIGRIDILNVFYSLKNQRFWGADVRV